MSHVQWFYCSLRRNGNLEKFSINIPSITVCTEGITICTAENLLLALWEDTEPRIK
jgi:hypothetical protein